MEKDKKKNKPSAESIIKNFDKLNADRVTLLDTWQDIARFIMPAHAYFTKERQSGSDDNSDFFESVYDTTAMRANEVLASSLHGGITPNNAVWFLMRSRNKNQSKAVKEWLEECAEKMMEALNESNFINAISQTYLDLGAFCSAALWVDDESQGLAFGRLKFSNIHLSKVVFKEGISGKAEFIWVEISMPANVAMQKFKEASQTEAMEQVREIANSDNPYEEVKFIVHCYPNYGEDGSVIDYQICIVSKLDKKTVDERVETKSPFMIPRWQRATGQEWGSGCGIRALPDIRVINRAKEMELNAYDESINRGYVTTAGNILSNTIDRKGTTIVKDPNKLRPLTEGDLSWNVAQIKGDEIQNSIRSMFYEDRLVLPTTSGDTATEFRIRYDLLQRQLAPTMGRLQVELLNPIIERVFDLMMQGGALPPIPEEFEDTDEVDIEYTAPLVRSRQSQEVEAINQWLSMTANLSQIYPEVRHKVDVLEASQRLAESLDIPQELVISNEDALEKYRQERQAQIEAEAAENGAPQPQQPPQES